MKKFFYIFILITIFLTIYANIINLANTASQDKNLKVEPNESISYFVSTNSENLFWPTPRLS